MDAMDFVAGYFSVMAVICLIGFVVTVVREHLAKS